VGSLATTSSVETERSGPPSDAVDASEHEREAKVTVPDGLKRIAEKAVATADEKLAAAAAANAAKVKAAGDKVSIRPARPGDKIAREKRGRAPAPPPPKPIGAALITAAIATLLGVGVTFGVITMLDKRAASDAPAAANDGPALRSIPSAQAETTTSTATIGSTAPSPSASASSPAAPASGGAPSSSAAGSGKVGNPSPPRTNPVVNPPLPRPSSTKPLDIQRDLP
jgi:hypothetical protein